MAALRSHSQYVMEHGFNTPSTALLCLDSLENIERNNFIRTTKQIFS